MEKRYYIAYGSNLHTGQMKFRCPNSRVIGTAEVKDYRLLFKGSGTGAYLTIERAEGYSVPVAVWEVSTEDELSLDCYEGYPTFYYKKEFNLDIKGIKSGKIRNRKVFVYIMHEERKIGIPSIQYMRTCITGYETFGFDLNKLIEAYQFSKEVVK